MVDVTDVLGAVRSSGLDVRLDGDEILIDVGGERRARPWRWVSECTPRDVVVSTDREEFLLAGHVTPAVAELARAHALWFADASGTVHLRGPGILVDVRRRGGGGRKSAPGPATINLMSSRRAQVVFCLLAWPDLVGQPIRFLGQVAGVSASLAQLVVGALRESGHLSAHGRRLERSDELVEQWVGAYPRGLGRSLVLGQFDGAPALDAWREAGTTVRVSGEQAVGDLVGGDTLTFYVPELDPRKVAASRWRRADDPRIVVRRLFWTDPTGSGPRIAPAPALMVYADLIASGDPRQREVARQMRGEVLGPRPR